ncbi:MAG: rod shape-determining protein MreC [Microthrixaceae bacterium]
MLGSPRRRPRTTVAILILATFTLMTANAKDVPVLKSVRSGVIDAFGPIGRGFRTATKPIRSWWGGATDYDRLESENARLRNEVGRLRAKQQANADAVSELARLKEQEGIGFVGTIDSVLAQVATGPYSSFDDNRIQIDHGSRSGLTVGMPVVTSGGLVGILSSVTPGRAIVQLVTDPDLHVSVKLAASGNYAIGHGNGPSRPFVVDDGVELAARVDVGESVVTSGLGSARFPADIPVGVVRKVSRGGADLSQVLDVDLAADLVRLDYVRVLKWRERS